MPSDLSSNNARLVVLRQREIALKAAIAEERVRQEKRIERENARLAMIIGSVLVREADGTTEFRDMLTRILRGSDISESDRTFLEKRHWL